jgi:AraC-like DNA-binding protein
MREELPSTPKSPANDTPAVEPLGSRPPWQHCPPMPALAWRNNEAGYLLEKAIACFDTDRQVARRYLTDALILIRREPTEFEPDAPISHYTWRPGGLPKWQAQRALRYIDANLGSKLSAAGIANTIALSPSYFSHSFRLAMGCPPMTYVTVKRLERAKSMMISTTERLLDIALTCGFGDQPHFTKLFRRWIGVTPSVWRAWNITSE